MLKSFSRCWVDVIADRTDRRLTRDLMLDAVPNSSASILAAREIWSLGGKMREIMLVPLLPHAAPHAVSGHAVPGRRWDGNECRGRGVRRS